MKEKTLFKIALLCSVMGIIGLFFFSEHVEVERKDVYRITDEDIGKEIKVIGRIERVNNTEKVIYLQIGQEKIETVSVVLFKDSDLKLEKGDYVELIGKVDEYKGKRNIIANTVKLR